MVDARAARRLFVLVAVLATGALAVRPHAQSAGVTPADDAYHFASWADGRHDGAYNEWWYFNVFDARSGVQAILSYFVADPGNLSGSGQARMIVVAYTPGGVVSAIDDYPLSSFAASASEADVMIGANSVTTTSAGGAERAAGASADGRVSWDLSFAPRATPWFAADRMPVGHLAWEAMSWLVFMPRARVTGRLVVDGRTYDVDAAGYHDHNWGEWIPTDAMWNWGQYSDPRTAFDMGVFIGQPVGLASVAFDGSRVVFTPDQYTLVHTQWAWDAGNGVLYPTESRFTADNGSSRLVVAMRVLATEPLRGDLPWPLRDVIIYEQTAVYDGRLWTKDPAGQWVLARRFHGPGFKEFTAKRY